MTIQILNTEPLHQLMVRAKKIKPVRAIHMRQVFTNPFFSKFFLLDALEGAEPVDSDAMLCVGEAGDVWQQKLNKMMAKYDVVEDEGCHGWFIATPKPENENRVIKLSKEVIDSAQLNPALPIYIQGGYGAAIDGTENLQQVTIGSWLVQRLLYCGDQWIVQDNLFKNTYSLI